MNVEQLETSNFLTYFSILTSPLTTKHQSTFRENNQHIYELSYHEFDVPQIRLTVSVTWKYCVVHSSMVAKLLGSLTHWWDVGICLRKGEGAMNMHWRHLMHVCTLPTETRRRQWKTEDEEHEFMRNSSTKGRRWLWRRSSAWQTSWQL